MKLKEFKIRKDFWMSGRPWRCTDKGTRTVAAIDLSTHPDDPTWYFGPPYAIPEHVIDEYDMQACHPEKPDEDVQDSRGSEVNSVPEVRADFVQPE